MNLSKLAVKRPVTIAMATLIIVLLGLVSLTRIPIDLLPSIEVPVAIVSTSYRGAGPLEIEELITKPIEQVLATVSNMKTVSSNSSQGSSIVIVEFNYGTDMNFATLEMREKIDMIKSFLPKDASTPMVLKIDPNAMPIMQISLYGDDDFANIQEIAEDVIKPRLERLEGVASVEVAGGLENYVEIRLKDEVVKGYGLSSSYIAQIIGAENLNLPGGDVQMGNKRLTVRTLGQFQSLEELRDLPIPLRTGGIIRLKDVSDVNFTYKDVNSISKTNGINSINITIQKESGTNTVKVAETVKKELDKLKEEVTKININIVMDQSEYINESIANVVKNTILGGLLAILVLYLFLRNIRTTIIIGTSIPVSVIATFILLYFNNITLNLMTLGGLALGVGMLVDNAIVVLENIYRFRQEGNSQMDASIQGASEVAMAVTASTLTTIAVFVPIVFVGGMTASIFKELALTVTLSLVTSLIVSLTLIPMLSSKFLSVDMMQGKNHAGTFKFLSVLYNLFDKVFYKVESLYEKTLNWSLHHRKTTVFIAILVFLGSLASILRVGTEYFPSVDRGEISINIALPTGSELEETNSIVETIEEKLSTIEEVNIVVSNIGTNRFQMFGGGVSSNIGSVDIKLVPLSERNRSTTEVSEEIRRFIEDIPGSDIQVNEQSSAMMIGGFSQAPLVINIKGDDLNVLKSIGYDFKSIAESIEGTREIESDITEGIPEVHIILNRLKASQYGLTTAQVASMVKSTLSGSTVTRYKYKGSEIDVVIKGDPRFSEGLTNLEQIPVQTPLGTIVPLREIGEVTINRGPVSINREDQVRVISITGQIVGRDLGSITDDIEERFQEYDMPSGYTYEIAGENEEIKEAFSDLSLALILAVVLVFMILASQFESLLHPLTIMLSVPIAFAGGALGLFLTGKSLSVPALIGFIILAGIVVNNAIVLVDYINTRRNMGEERLDAILKSGPIRLRPILMTTLTTVLGLIPLALGIGEGAELQAPLAISVIGGLLLSTLLTLVFVPVMYTLIDDLGIYLKKTH